MEQNEKKNETVKSKVTEGYKKIETGVVEGYKKIENGVVDGYKKMENGVVEGFNKINDTIIEKVFSKEGEPVEETKARLSGKKPESKADENDCE